MVSPIPHCTIDILANSKLLPEAESADCRFSCREEEKAGWRSIVGLYLSSGPSANESLEMVYSGRDSTARYTGLPLAGEQGKCHWHPPVYPPKQGILEEAANHEASVALYFMHYNFCRVHQSLRVSPAMEAA